MGRQGHDKLQRYLQPSEARQAVLEHYGFSAAPPDEALDRVTRLASRIFGVPISLVGVIGDDWPWFKSCYGLSVEDFDPDIAFCVHAVQADEVTVVLDAARDDRFADNPLVTGKPHIRFYAGAALTTPDGVKLGTLCVMDTGPRTEFSEAQRAMLEDLAAVVVAALEASVLARELRVSENRYRVVAETASDAVVTIDMMSRIRYVNRAASTIFGYAA